MPRRFRRSARQPELPKQLALSALGMVIRGLVILVVCLVGFKVISCQSKAWYDAESKKLEERKGKPAKQVDGAGGKPQAGRSRALTGVQGS